MDALRRSSNWRRHRCGMALSISIHREECRPKSGDRPSRLRLHCDLGWQARAARSSGIRRHWLKAPGRTLLFRNITNDHRTEEHTSELQSLMRISYAVFCLNKNKKNKKTSH